MKLLSFVVFVALAFTAGCSSEQDSPQVDPSATAKAKDAAEAQLGKALTAVTAADDKIAGMTKQLGAADLKLTEDRDTIEKLRQEITRLKSRLAAAEQAAQANEQEAAEKSNTAK